jgi:UDP-2,3-diacylglucosamine hydrolase
VWGGKEFPLTRSTAPNACPLEQGGRNCSGSTLSPQPAGWEAEGLTRSGKDWIFVSDAHFTGKDCEEMETFLRFLNLEKEHMSHLVILGDLFEFFFGFKKVFSEEKPFPFTEYLPVLERLQILSRHGIHIKYFEGNHDFFLHSLFSEQFQMEVEVHPGGSEEWLGGKKTFVAHGDLSNPKQWRYRAFRRVLKNQWTYGLMQWAGPRLSRPIARWLSQMSYQRYHRGQPSHPPPAFKAFAHRKFVEGFEIVILGHSHFPEEEEEWLDERRCRYFNVGDWRTHRSFLRFTPPDRFELSRFME